MIPPYSLIRWRPKNSPVTGLGWQIVTGLGNFSTEFTGMQAKTHRSPEWWLATKIFTGVGCRSVTSPEWAVGQSLVTGVGSWSVNCHRSESVIFHRSEQDLRFFTGVWTFFHRIVSNSKIFTGLAESRGFFTGVLIIEIFFTGFFTGRISPDQWIRRYY